MSGLLPDAADTLIKKVFSHIRSAKPLPPAPQLSFVILLAFIISFLSQHRDDDDSFILPCFSSSASLSLLTLITTF